MMTDLFRLKRRAEREKYLANSQVRVVKESAAAFIKQEEKAEKSMNSKISAVFNKRFGDLLFNQLVPVKSLGKDWKMDK